MNKIDNDTYTKWNKKIDGVLKSREKWVTKGEKIFRRYRAEDCNEFTDSRYNILYSNTETLQPVIYSQAPKSEVRATNTKVVSQRKSAEMIEEAIDYQVSSCDFNNVARLAVTDFLLSGAGVIRPKYKPTLDEVEEVVLISDITSEDKIEEEEDGTFVRKIERVVFEEVEYEYVHWKDLLFPDATTWENVTFIAFRTYMTKEEATSQFGAKKAELLNYEPVKENNNETLEAMKESLSAEDKAMVYEIWDKATRQQIFFAKTIDMMPLEVNEDPLELEGFFPIPQPMFSITTSGTVYPVPFFMMYQDQAIELDDLTSRINSMINNMRRRGFYDASIDELTNISTMSDNAFFPIKDWQTFAGKGGLNAVMQTEDISTYANILIILSKQRKQLIEDIYQIIGISDIRRGQSDPRETLGAQEMKGRYGTIRISTYQRKVAEYMRDLLKITGEIIINQFDPETIAVITSMPLETKTERDEQGNIVKADVGVIDLLKDLKSKSPSDISVDIETDSTIIEQQEDKKELVDLTSALAQFMGIAEGMSQVVGLSATSSILMSIVERFKLGRGIQQAVQDHIDKLEAQAEEAKKNPTPPPPTKEQIDLQIAQMKSQVEMQKIQSDAQVEAAKLAIKQQENMIKAQEIGIYAQMEADKVDIKALEAMIKAEGLKAEQANKNDNAIVGA
jgi:hypothetical protein